MIPIPRNLIFLVGLKDYRASVIEKIMKGELNTEESMIQLCQYWKLKVWFKEPVEIRTINRCKIIEKGEDGNWTKRQWSSSKTGQVHIIHHLFMTGMHGLAYTPGKRIRKGRLFPPMSLVERYEPVLKKGYEI